MSDIDDLDDDLANYGEDIYLRRLVSGSLRLVKVRAHVRSFRLSSNDLVSGIMTVPFVVIISMTQIKAAGWPQGVVAAAAPFNVDPGIPVIGDTAIIKGVARTVKAVDPMAVNDVVVKIKMMVEG